MFAQFIVPVGSDVLAGQEKSKACPTPETWSFWKPTEGRGDTFSCLAVLLLVHDPVPTIYIRMYLKNVRQGNTSEGNLRSGESLHCEQMV